MKRSTSLAWLLSILLILAGIAAQAHILESDLVPGKRIRTTWIDENQDTDELFRMYLGESPIMELRQDGSHRVYVHGDGRLLATADFSGPNTAPELYYYLLDHLGSTIAILDDDGQTVWPGSDPDEYQRYQPYGEFATEPDNAGTNIPSFTGKFADPGTGNHYFTARYHTSDAGMIQGSMQFSSPDPVYGKLSDPFSWNRYAYCRNNPVNYTDLTGMYFTYKNEKSFQTLWDYKEYLQEHEKWCLLEQFYDLWLSQDINYHINVKAGKGTEKGGATYAIGGLDTNTIEVMIYEDSERFPNINDRLAHEMRHSLQFERGQLGFIYPGDDIKPWTPFGYYKAHEVDAFMAQSKVATDLLKGGLNIFVRGGTFESKCQSLPIKYQMENGALLFLPDELIKLKINSNKGLNRIIHPIYNKTILYNNPRSKCNKVKMYEPWE